MKESRLKNSVSFVDVVPLPKMISRSRCPTRGGQTCTATQLNINRPQESDDDDDNDDEKDDEKEDLDENGKDEQLPLRTGTPHLVSAAMMKKKKKKKKKRKKRCEIALNLLLENTTRSL